MALCAAAITFIAVSIYCFWKANLITEQLWEKANDDPSAALLLMGKADAEIMAITSPELIRLSTYRSRSVKTGWVSMLLAIILLIAGLVLPIWRKDAKLSDLQV